MNTMPNKPDAANPRLRLGSMADVRGAGSLIRSVRRRALMPDRSEVEAVPREFVPVDFADAFIRVHPWHPCSNWMRSRLAGRGCESGDFGRRVLSDESWIFEQVGGANGDEPVNPVAIATSVAAHPRRSPRTLRHIARTWQQPISSSLSDRLAKRMPLSTVRHWRGKSPT